MHKYEEVGGWVCQAKLDVIRGGLEHAGVWIGDDQDSDKLRLLDMN